MREPRGRLRVAYYALPPFVYKEGSSLYGIDIDMWRILGRELQLEVSFFSAGTVGNIPAMVLLQ